MSEIYVYRSMILYLKESLAFKQAKLLFIVLICEINRYNFMTILNPLVVELFIISLEKSGKIVLNESFMIYMMVFLKCNVAYRNFRVNQ
jgi:hypothetical protein